MRDYKIIDHSNYLAGPLHVAFDVTNRCMLKCKHCFNRSGDLIRKELNEEEFINVVHQIAELKPFSICFCGGEPLMRRNQLAEATRILREGGVEYVAMVSNGFLMTSELAKSLAEAGVSMIQFSVDGFYPETHDEMRGVKGSHEKVLNAIEIVEASPMDFSLAFSPTRLNIKEFPLVVEKFRHHKSVTTIRVQPLMPMGKATASKDSLLPTEEQYRELVKYIEKFSSENTGKYPIVEWGDPIDHLRRFTELNFKKNAFVEIKSDGTLSASGYLPIKFGNLREHSLKEYWDAGLGRVWEIPALRSLAESVGSVCDLGFEDLNLPKTFFDEDLFIDMVKDRPLESLEEFTLEKCIKRSVERG